MKKNIATVISILLFSCTAFSAYSESNERINDNNIGFREVWGYMMRGEENLFTGSEPVTDVFYFSCSLDYKGRLNTSVQRPVLPDTRGIKRKIHIVITELSNPALVHFALDPAFNVRDNLVNDIIRVSEKFDGVQIDFESVAADDSENFYTFLRLIRDKMNADKIFSIALPARRKYVRDAYDYPIISSIVDRVFIMTYDEHWSTSKPGPVASYSWCNEVAIYAVNNIPRGKVVLGLPFYGRSWQDKTFSRSIKTANLDDHLSKQGIVHEILGKDGNKISYRETVDVTVFCDDKNSIYEKLVLFRQYSDSVGFWRLGFEKSDLWYMISIQNGE